MAIAHFVSYGSVGQLSNGFFFLSNMFGSAIKGPSGFEVRVRGWLAHRNIKNIKIIIISNGSIKVIYPVLERQDIVRNGNAGDLSEFVRGFDNCFTIDGDCFLVGVQLGTKITFLEEGVIKKPPAENKVAFGRGGMLFLQNDKNDSKAQFINAKHVSKKNLSEWLIRIQSVCDFFIIEIYRMAL